MEITLTLDEETAARVLALARQRRMPLDRLVTELLAQACGEGPGDKFVGLAQAHGGRSQPGWRFDRDECHDRRAGT